MKGPEKQKKKKKSNRFLAVPLSQLDVSPPYPRGIPRIDKSRSRARRQPSLQCWRWKPPTEPTVSPDKMWRRRPTLAWRKESHCISLDGTASKWPCKINGAAMTPSKNSTSLLLIFFLGSLNQMVFYFIDVLLWTSCFLLFNYLEPIKTYNIYVCFLSICTFAAPLDVEDLLHERMLLSFNTEIEDGSIEEVLFYFSPFKSLIDNVFDFWGANACIFLWEGISVLCWS